MAPAFLAVFLCNHCPYARHVQGALVALIKEYQPRGLAAVGISANDIGSHPQDGPDQMAKEAVTAGYTFPYLYDESQEVAKAYRAACTPDFFLFDKSRVLVYRGQMDASRPGNGVPLTGVDLRNALDAVLAGKPVTRRTEAQPRLRHQVEARQRAGLHAGVRSAAALVAECVNGTDTTRLQTHPDAHARQGVRRGVCHVERGKEAVPLRAPGRDKDGADRGGDQAGGPAKDERGSAIEDHPQLPLLFRQGAHRHGNDLDQAEAKGLKRERGGPQPPYFSS